MLKILSLAAVILAFSNPLAAHEAPSGWSYPGWCCSGKDCAVIPKSSVTVVKDGYLVKLKAGDHPMVTYPAEWFIRQKDAQISQDEDYHICFYPTQATQRCFFAPPMAF